MNCPVCSSDRSVALVRRRQTPIFQNAVLPTPERARAAATGDLEFRRCSDCGFVWNAAFDSGLIRYSDGYDNSQVHSAAFIAHLGSRIERIIAALPAAGPVTIVEIGCGQGDFLHRLYASLPKERSIRAIGFDPAYRGGFTKDNAEVYPEYFTAETAQRLEAAPDVVISRHTIEHVPDPVAFLQAIRGTIGGKPAALFLETPDNEWILRNRAYHDFFYEHCSIFDFRSMDHALRRSGFLPERLETCFGGQYLWVEAVAADESVEDAEAFENRAADFVATWRSAIAELRAKGPVVLWGAGAKGATFALMIDPGKTLIDAVVDKNPGKIGAFIPITAHPIVAPESLKNVGAVLIMNPNYESEIRDQLARMGQTADVVVLR